MVTAARWLTHGTCVLANLGWVIFASAVVVAAFAPLAMRSYRKER